MRNAVNKTTFEGPDFKGYESKEEYFKACYECAEEMGRLYDDDTLEAFHLDMGAELMKSYNEGCGALDFVLKYL